MDYSKLYSRIKNLYLVSKKLAETVFAGTYRTAFKGPGLEFDEVREYTDNDDMRSIDWNVTSRMNAPYSKKYKEERELNFFFIMDISASIETGIGAIPRREMIGILSSLLSYAAIMNNDRVGAVFFTDKIEKWIPPTKGQKQVTRLINDMMSLKAEGKGSDLGTAVSTVYKSLKRRGVCVILSDFKTNSGWREMTLLARRHDVIVIKVSDPIDYEIPISGLVDAVDPETSTIFSFVGRSRRFKAHYKRFYTRNHDFWERECKRRKIDNLAVSTNDDPVTQLLHFFGKRRVQR